MKNSILLIENDPLYAEHFRRACEKTGFRLEIVPDPVRDMGPLIRNTYGCYFVDLDADLARGLQTINLLNEMKHNPCLVAMISASGRIEEEKIRSKGITFLLEKPFEQDIIEELLNAKKMREAF